ncbi:tyrosine-type recombinase/integrase [Desulfolutivibrio sp.]|uniref:tyrosine-type recombinase/integrase n=1 Tax=Desulfolutivibrio sp. TaxID=2773296 RepID=UPI002F963620
MSYDIRHLFCATLLYEGCDAVTASKLMGHASTKMTLDQYGHVLVGAKRRAVGLLPELTR